MPQAGGNLNVQWLIDRLFLVEEYLGGTTPPCMANTEPRQGGVGGVPVC